MATVYIGMGSNLDDPERQLRKAVNAIAEQKNIRLVSDSGLFKSKPMTLDNEPQPDYFNAVVKVETSMTPPELLDHLQSIENQQGRVREKKWGPRTLDLDILIYDDLQLKNERLTIPHPGIAHRAFVLYPLKNIESELAIPGLGKLSELLSGVSADDVEYAGELQ